MIGQHDDLKALIRTIPGFPKPGIQFRDITTLLLDAQGFAAAIERLAFRIEEKPDLVAGIEARGFLVAAALAQRLGAEIGRASCRERAWRSVGAVRLPECGGTCRSLRRHSRRAG